MEVESDFTAMKIETLIQREQRKELFDERWLHKFKMWLGDEIYWDDKKQCYTLKIPDGLDILTMDYFPKGNRLLIPKLNKWYYGGAKYLVNNYLPQEFKE